MLVTIVVSAGTLVAGYFIGAHRQKLLNIKNSVEKAVKEEISKP